MILEFSHKFVKQLKKAPKDVQKAVRVRLEIYATDKFHPLLNNHALTGNFQGFRSVNITGDWRAVFLEIDGKIAHFEALGTHSQLYK